MSQADRIRSINDPGWEGVDAVVSHLPLNKEQRELDLLYARTFRTEEGIKVLEHLKSITTDQPCWIPGADPSFGFAREGQNSIIREIEQRIKRINE